ncbi:VOC family protein [Bacillus sp. J14TS2]|uniref:VOC family protein n=1 Tax=Bacillus sp. J14TS2 TaxID=2807188 RepID=UPI001B156653|nr:VOC family protein [Bacillus sp. J14TS2]GIN74237.1 VOC family protein [Bacillus sp. J14TS2]
MIVNIYPYLTMNGNGQEAIKFYENALNATVLNVQTFGDMPENPGSPPMTDEAKNRVLNAHLKIGDTDLMISDTFPGPHEETYQLGSQVTIAITINNAETSKEVFTKLLEDGQEIMALQETFWSPLYGQVTDKFGVTWQISTNLHE